MVRAIFVFAVVILVLAEIRAQGGGQTCGRRECEADQCCVGLFMRRCRNLPTQNQMCGNGMMYCTECAAGLECRPFYDGFQLGRCQQQTTSSTSSESSSTSTSTSMESSSTATSTSTDGVSTDV